LGAYEFGAAAPSGPSDEAFIRALYRETLFRDGRPDEVAFYTGLIARGRLTRAQAAFNFVNSPENRGNQVRAYYRDFLGREASQGEVDFYVEHLRGGGDEARVAQNFILSPEFTGGHDDAQFTHTMYDTILGRIATPTEVDFYVTALDSGETTRPQVVLNFLYSPEGVGRVVRRDYLAYLGREPRDGEVAFWRSQVDGGATLGSVAVGVLGSDEFYANAGGNP
jgi:hypothetical protein